MRTALWLGIMMSVAVGMAADLPSYVKAESIYEWSKTLEGKVENSQFVEITMVSQKWREFTWRHRLRLVKPSEVRHPETAILYITGSGDGRSELQLIARAAERVGAIAAVLHDVPNQPLIRPDLVEDNLIAHTFVQYYDTGDESWPLLFPMVKSAVRAMDTAQAFAQKEWGIRVRDFLVTGASKRGWTTWLTAAVDPRVRAIAPMVFDNLNFSAQMPHQLKTWGKYSEQISEYSERNLMALMNTERGRKLVSMVDPYFYRERYTMPILIINGANDPYWVIDAAQFYFNELPSSRKYALYVPNGGHGLGDYERVLNTMTAFYRMAVGELEFPRRVEGSATRQNNRVRYTVRADRAPERVQVWVAHSNTLDFRPSRWEPVDANREGREWVATIELPQDANLALFAELTYRAGNQRFTLCTVPTIVGQ